MVKNLPGYAVYNNFSIFSPVAYCPRLSNQNTPPCANGLWGECDWGQQIDKGIDAKYLGIGVDIMVNENENNSKKNSLCGALIVYLNVFWTSNLIGIERQWRQLILVPTHAYSWIIMHHWANAYLMRYTLPICFFTINFNARESKHMLKQKLYLWFCWTIQI